MIGSFPDLYSDELFYSACARFSSRMDYPNKKAVLRELFGSSNITATIDLPCHLGRFMSSLPPRHLYTVDGVIDQHTLLPFFSHFLPLERVALLRSGMQDAGGMTIHKRSGIMASRIPTPTRLRFCPLCIYDDRGKFGEAFWHRIHQVPGVLVCPTHHVSLEDSDARRDSARDNLQFIPVELACRAMPARHVEFTNPDHLALFKIACDAQWMLQEPSMGMNLDALRARYLRLLIGRGLATYTGGLHVTKLLSKFSQYYSPSLLKLLRCEFTGSDQQKTNWLLRLVRPPKHAQHPLYHLLLMQFLGCTAKEFFQLSTELSLFGEGPWPCLNPAADHFREPVIPEYKLSSRLRDGRPTASFSCGCGFTYARSGPDSSLKDKFRVGRMISFGPIWEAKLRQFWKDSSLSLSEIGRRLGVDPLTVRRHAIRLKLQTSHLGRRSKPLNRASQLKSVHSSTAQVRKRSAYYNEWVTAMWQTSKLTLKDLRRKHSRAYAWLLKNDTEWLKRHSPPSRRCGQHNSGIDWQKRDTEYVVAVRTAATRLKNNPGRPMRVTRSAIGRAVGAVTLLQQKLHKMPLTAQAITNVVETRVEYAVRRVEWAAEYFTRAHIQPRPWQLILSANVYGLRGVLEVKCAVAAALCLIESTLSLKQELKA